MRPPTGVAAPPVPIQEAVSEFIGELLGLGAAATKVTPSKIEPDGEHIVAVYHDQRGRVAALTIADLRLAASTAAALAMIPSTAVKEAVQAGELTETLLENYREVANISASLLNSPNTPHLKLDRICSSGDADLPQEVWPIVAEPLKRREFAVTIDGYGDGRLAIYIR